MLTKKRLVIMQSHLYSSLLLQNLALEEGEILDCLTSSGDKGGVKTMSMPRKMLSGQGTEHL